MFVPVAFLTGRVGRLFNEFGIAVAVSVLISGFVALTLTPMLCSRLLRGAPHSSPGEGGGPASGPGAEARGWRGTFNRGLAAFTRGYERILRFSLRRRGMVMLSGLGLIAAMVGLFRVLPSELVPTEDRGLIFNLVLAPEGSTLEYTDRYVRQAEAIYQNVPEVDRMFTAVGLGFGAPGRVTDGFMFVRLKPYHERKRSQQEIVRSLFPQMMSIPGVLAIPINPPSLGGGFGRPVQFVLQAENYDDARRGDGRDDDGGAEARLPGQHGQRPQAQQAAARNPDRPRPRRGAGRVGAGDRQHAADAARRPRGRARSSSATASTT